VHRPKNCNMIHITCLSYDELLKNKQTSYLWNSAL